MQSIILINYKLFVWLTCYFIDMSPVIRKLLSYVEQ